MPNTTCQIADTIANAKYEMPNNCQIVYPSTECQLKLYMDKAVKHHNAMEQKVMKRDSTISEQFVSALIDEKFGYLSETQVRLSNNCVNLQISNMKEINVRNSRATTVPHPHFRMKREREPSRISYRMVTRFNNRKKLRNAVKLYIKKCVPKSSALRTMLYAYHRHHFFERYTRSNSMISSKKCYTRQSLFIFQTRTSKHKKAPLFCINGKGNFFRKLKQLLCMKTYRLSRRIILLSGDVESNPGPTSWNINNAVPSTRISPTV